MTFSNMKFLALAATLSGSLMSVNAVASSITLTPDGRWYQFDVDELISSNGGLEWIDAVVDESAGYVGDGSALNFNFELQQAAYLTVVDAGLAGDRFSLVVNGTSYDSSTPSYQSILNVGNDFDAALAHSSQYSRLQILLNPGLYTVSGSLLTSAQDEFGLPLNATVGGIQVSAVPVPAAFWLLGSALTGLAVVSRRKA